ncbi:cobalt-precorrin 5A hydrolase/precorrin-3B C17-methyltransferase [Motilibacter peucedani]|uniref:Cobalt-precorrin 5A hydrolase/precorrin-3B C17-methyltransferase n=1 Tax=Motilibacter peucedani TaxID=598650 RepID=A0A420XNL4_9ACTN|nr:precorrin-3B C(17)-methyltransferase [Motilibacter peucedani]RKS73787.1 cobalt-precorrin 5A hydrolase/precorrin-3B C17-methyltransferase [Motilibacter peucedani]
MIGLVAVTAAGRAAAAELAAAWPDETRTYDTPAREALAAAWGECESVVAFLAVGAAVRLVAPLLGAKDEDPGLVCVDEGRRWAVAVVGGHAGGANALAERVSGALLAQPVVTTATDSARVQALDMLGWPVEGAVARVSRALLDGEAVRLEADAVWPLPALPTTVGDAGEVTLRVTDRVVTLDAATAVLRPPSLVVGAGASRGVTADEVLSLVDASLAAAGLSPASVRHLATVEAKADEQGIVEAASTRGWSLVVHPADVLAAVDVPNPSDVVLAEVGTPSVAEASALVEPGAELLVAKQKSAMATVAVARLRPRGRLAVVGLGPGARDLMAPRAAAELARASVVVGLDQYLDQVRDLIRPGTRVLSSGLGDEEARALSAVAEARAGHAVALIGSGDAGVYAMASPALVAAGDDIDVVGVPGITAALAASALLGAPLGHDAAYVSLSDLHTPWDAIERRVQACAEGDFVTVFYNPRSRQRDWQLPKALGILAAHRPPTTPVGVVRNASRPGERTLVTTLTELDPADVDMFSVVLVGSTNTTTVAGRIVTPRGYTWQS